MRERPIPEDVGGSESVDSVLRALMASSEGSSGDPAPKLSAGEVVAARFRVEALAGQGGMGAVYRATDQMGNTTVALKVISAAPSKASSRFSRESHVLSVLSHPAVVRYVAHGTTMNDVPFLAMEWLEGEDLAARLRRGPLAVSKSLALIRVVAHGLAHAHARGVVHRDVKPSNLFLVGGDEASVKILDFGMARLTGSGPVLTRTGTVLGTLGYMAPEQALGEPNVGSQADVFSLGCVLFECLTGRPAFTGRTPIAVFEKLLRTDPPRVSDVRPELGPSLDVFVASLLQKRAEDRPRDLAAILAAVDAIDGLGECHERSGEGAFRAAES
jgi:serine/threonine protein kinase